MTRGSKRRQGLCGVRQVSLERPKFAEAELVPFNEGNMCIVATRDGAAPPGSGIASRTKGYLWDPGGPAGSFELVAEGGVEQGKPELCAELRPGVGLASSTDEAAEQNRKPVAEAVEGRGQPEGIS